jgi:hypothetical protein
MDIDASDLLKLAADLEVEPKRVARDTYPVVKRLAKELEEQWRSNATSTARRHGKHYPKAITAEQLPMGDGPWWEVGPESAKRQGGMGRGFEFGSVNQPPHWDGTRAAVGIEPKLYAAIDAVARSFLA